MCRTGPGLVGKLLDALFALGGLIGGLLLSRIGLKERPPADPPQVAATSSSSWAGASLSAPGTQRGFNSMSIDGSFLAYSKLQSASTFFPNRLTDTCAAHLLGDPSVEYIETCQEQPDSPVLVVLVHGDDRSDELFRVGLPVPTADDRTILYRPRTEFLVELLVVPGDL